MCFLRELVVYIFIFKNWADVSQFLSIFFFAAMTNLHSTCAGESSEENLFFYKKIIFVFGFWSTKTWFWETTRHVRKNCPYVEKRTFGAKFFENVISRIIIFRNWAEYFLPSMERVWYGCEKGILRDQTTFKGAYIFEVRETKLLNFSRPRAEEFETIGFIFWRDFRNCILFAEMKVGSVNTFFWYISRLWVSNYFPFLASIFVRGLSKMYFLSPEDFCEEMTSFGKWFFPFWVWSRKFLTFGIKLFHGFKNWSSSDHRIFSRKRIHQWKPQYLIFSRNWAENCSDIGEFFLAICQKAIYDCSGAFRGKGKNWDKFWQSLP